MSEKEFEPTAGPEPPPPFDVMEVDLAKISSPALRRLIEEVRVEEDPGARYSRFHNRHNRSSGRPRPW